MLHSERMSFKQQSKNSIYMKRTPSADNMLYKLLPILLPSNQQYEITKERTTIYTTTLYSQYHVTFCNTLSSSNNQTQFPPPLKSFDPKRKVIIIIIVVPNNQIPNNRN